MRDEFDIPIMGVVIPGARAAVETTRNQKVGVIGTDATGTERNVHESHPKHGSGY